MNIYEIEFYLLTSIVKFKFILHSMDDKVITLYWIFP